MNVWNLRLHFHDLKNTKTMPILYEQNDGLLEILSRFLKKQRWRRVIKKENPQILEISFDH
jgi:hypothetical protein